jgi:hypothetical protein
MCSFDGSSDALQEGSNILLGRLGEQFPVGIIIVIPGQMSRSGKRRGAERCSLRDFLKCRFWEALCR